MTSTVATLTRPEAAFHGVVGNLVDLLDPVSEADPIALVVETLASFGSMVDRRAYVRVGSVVQGANLFVGVVGGTSAGRKGTASRDVMAIMKEVDPRWAASCAHTGVVSGEGLLELVRDPIWETRHRRRKGETAYERVCTDFGVADKRCLVREPEFARVLRAIKGGSLASVLRAAWDGGDLASASRKDPIRCSNTHISVVGHVTIEEFLREVDPVDASNGLLNRFAWFRTQRAKVIAIPESPDGEELKGLVKEFRAALSAAATRGAVGFSEDAKALYKVEYESHLCPLVSRPGFLGALLARAAPQVLRLSLLYALLDRSAAIEVVHLRAALALWAHAEATCAWMAATVERAGVRT